MTDVDPVLAALRARQDAELAYQKAFWACLVHQGELPEGWAARRERLRREMDRAVERHCRVYERIKRRVES